MSAHSGARSSGHGQGRVVTTRMRATRHHRGSPGDTRSASRMQRRCGAQRCLSPLQKHPNIGDILIAEFVTGKEGHAAVPDPDIARHIALEHTYRGSIALVMT
jgi:hypothetical protein